MPRLHPYQIAHSFTGCTGPDMWRDAVHEAIGLHDPALVQTIFTQNPGLTPDDWYIETLVRSDDYAGFKNKARFAPFNEPLSENQLSGSGPDSVYYDARDQYMSEEGFTRHQLEILKILRKHGAKPQGASSYKMSCTDDRLTATEAFAALAIHNVENYDLKAALVMEALYLQPDWAPKYELATLFANAAGATPQAEAAIRYSLHKNAATVGIMVAERLVDTPEIAFMLTPEAQKFWQRTPAEWAELESLMPQPSYAGRQYFAAKTRGSANPA